MYILHTVERFLPRRQQEKMFEVLIQENANKYVSYTITIKDIALSNSFLS